VSNVWTIRVDELLHHQMVAAGLLVWVAVTLWRAARHRVWWPHAAATLGAMFFFGALGARLMALAAGSVSGPWYQPLAPGYSSFGLFAGALVGLAIAGRACGMDLPRLLDVVTPGSLSGLAVTRLGCLFRGCDFGAPTHAWGVRYGPDAPAFAEHLESGLIDDAASRVSEVVHAFPIYASACALIGAIVALFAARTDRPGQALWGASTYLVLRSVAEVFRADDTVWHWFSVNANLVMSLVGAVLTTALALHFDRERT